MSRLSLSERKSALKYGKIKENSIERELPEIEKARGVNKGAQDFLDRGGTHAVLVDVLKKTCPRTSESHTRYDIRISRRKGFDCSENGG